MENSPKTARAIHARLVAPAWKVQQQEKASGVKATGPLHVVQTLCLHVQEHQCSGFVPKSSREGARGGFGGGCSAQSPRKELAGSLWAGRPLVVRNPASKAHRGASPGQILFRNFPLCSLCSSMRRQVLLLPLSDFQLCVRKPRVRRWCLCQRIKEHSPLVPSVCSCLSISEQGPDLPAYKSWSQRRQLCI